MLLRIMNIQLCCKNRARVRRGENFDKKTWNFENLFKPQIGHYRCMLVSKDELLTPPELGERAPNNGKVYFSSPRYIV